MSSERTSTMSNGPGTLASVSEVPEDSEAVTLDADTIEDPRPAGAKCACVASLPSCHKCTFGEHHRKIGAGFLLMCLGAVCWVGTVESAKRTYRWPKFFAPFFVVYFSTAWLIVCYPLYLCGHFLGTRGKMALKETFRDSTRVFGEEGLAFCPHKIAAKCAGFSVLWMLMCYSFVRALHFKGGMDAVALFATNSNFVYLMSWIILQNKFIAVRIVAFIVAMTGIIMVTYMDDGFASEEMWGSVLVMVGTASAAAYKVLFRRLIGEVTYAQVAFFVSCVGVSCALTMWPLFLLFYFTQAEPVEWLSVPWVPIVAAAALALGLNLVLQFGAAVTYPQFIQASLILAIPLCVVAEYLLDETDFSASGMQVAAYILIAFGFALNILPENWQDIVLKALRWKSPQNSEPEDTHLSPRQRLRSSAITVTTN